LQSGEPWWGFLNAGYLAGTILGGLIALSFSGWIDQRLGISVSVGALVFGGFTLAFAYTTVPWISLALCVFMGPAGQMKDIAKRTLFQKNTDHVRLPKVFSANGTVIYSTFGISVFLMGYITDSFGVQMAFLFSSILYGISVTIAAWSRKSLGIVK
jgi:hypothetical protein